MAVPTGAQHEVGVEEMFFSTTDHRGIIEQANTTFVRLSRHPWEELIGAPHNVIRHPMMPGGAFRLMWDNLTAGHPFAAYVHNLAGDGSRYDVFAVLTPLRDGGYLSVRTRPLRTDLMADVDAVYAQAEQAEADRRGAGAGRAEAAGAGAEKVRAVLAGRGSDVAELIRTLVPAEVAALEERLGGLPRRPDATGALGDMLDLVHQVFDRLTDWMRALDRLSALGDEMATTVGELRVAIGESAATAKLIGRADSSWAPLMMPLQLWAEMGTEVRTVVAHLIDGLEEVRVSAGEARLRIAMARLFTHMTARFVVELIDHVSGSDRAAPAIGSLCRALQEGFEAMDEQVRRHRAGREETLRRVAETAGLLQIPLDLMAAWHTMATDREVPAGIAALMPRIEDQLAMSTVSLERLRKLAADDGAAGGDRQVTGLVRQVAQLGELAGAVA